MACEKEGVTTGVDVKAMSMPYASSEALADDRKRVCNDCGSRIESSAHTNWADYRFGSNCCWYRGGSPRSRPVESRTGARLASREGNWVIEPSPGSPR